MFTSELHMAFFTFKHQNVQLFCVPSRRVWLDELPYAYKERTKRNVEDELAPTKVRTRGCCVPPARFRTRPLLVSVHLPVCPFFCPFRTFQLKLAEQKLLGWDKKFTGCAAHVSMCMGPFIGSSTGPALV